MEPGDKRDNQDTNSTQRYTLPETEISEVLGFLELLNSKGGKADIYKLAQELQMEFGETIEVIRGAELLQTVNTPGGDVVLEPLGEKITQSSISERKVIIKNQIEKIPLFQDVSLFLKQNDDQEVTREEVLEKLVEMIPNENVERTFSTLVQWGRYAEIFGYNDDSHTFYLDTENHS